MKFFTALLLFAIIAIAFASKKEDKHAKKLKHLEEELIEDFKDQEKHLKKYEKHLKHHKKAFEKENKRLEKFIFDFPTDKDDYLSNILGHIQETTSAAVEGSTIVATEGTTVAVDGTTTAATEATTIAAEGTADIPSAP